MSRLFDWLKTLGWVGAGGALGFVAGVGVAVVAGLIRYMSDAGSGGIVIIFTAPLGFIFGMIGGAMWSEQRTTKARTRGFDVIAPPRGSASSE